MITTSDTKTWRSTSLQGPGTASTLSSSSGSRPLASQKLIKRQHKIFDDPGVVKGYESVPLLDVDPLPRGGVSLETKAVGRIQFGIPPETIKDSMLLGMEVPSVYIVPVERFCREIGPVLGINMAEFEFPAYFNYFVRQKRCTLVVDSLDAERDIRSVFEETLLGPEHFRNPRAPCDNVDEDFDPAFPVDARPNFYKEFYHFRTSEESSKYDELSVDRLLNFVHFKSPRRTTEITQDKLGVPPTLPEHIINPPIRPTRASEGRAGDTNRKVTFPTVTKDDTFPTVTKVDTFPTVTKDDIFLDLSIEDKPKLRRCHSESSDSMGTSNQSEQDSGSPRKSTAFFGSQEMQKKTDSRRSSMPLIGDSLRLNLLSADIDTSARRDSILSAFSARTSLSRSGRSSWFSSISGDDFLADESPDLQETSWMYSQVRWLGEVATVYPSNAQENDNGSKGVTRVEIFKMAGGTEYIIHDIDENNIIVGKARISGTVRAPDALSVEGFTSPDFQRLDGQDFGELSRSQRRSFSSSLPPSFHPPSFGVTVLGNSHGFDKNGSTSGYVLWVNGRGIMVDPPPYSSATLEREGIRPQMIMAIIITHCHADHDAGTFQKVMTGSRVAIITTPTIYKSFIRKYSALSGLRSTLLRHSHRHRPAIIGQPLRFQGAVFHFTYTLHTIPCISFRVEWRGKSIVFTGDHMNIPTAIDSLEQKGVLSKGRADDLRRLPLQNCDVLLHEAGAPPIHTPLSVLQGLPENVKQRLYVVHTAAIPPDCGLKVAPTGTAGTIRLDAEFHIRLKHEPKRKATYTEQGMVMVKDINSTTSVDGDKAAETISHTSDEENATPHVFSRPTDVSDAWFILNLLSAVPFLSNLSYAHTMEILEIAQVEVYSSGEVVVEGFRRPEFLCVFWEGTCVANRGSGASGSRPSSNPVVWHAGDWTGPVSLQPDINRSADSTDQDGLGDIVALSVEGVKVILLKMKDVVRILKAGSNLFRKYVALTEEMEEKWDQTTPSNLRYSLQDAVERSSEIMGVIQCNSVLRSLTAMQKRCLESLAEGPKRFASFAAIWKVGDPVNYAYLVVSGSATIGKRTIHKVTKGSMGRRGSTGAISVSSLAAIKEMECTGRTSVMFSPLLAVENDKLLQNVHPNSEYSRLEARLRIRAEEVESGTEASDGPVEDEQKEMIEALQAHSDKFANKVLARLYARRAYTENLIFSRGNFLSDTSRMVSGVLANTETGGYGRSSLATGGADNHCHTSNLVAGQSGCVVLVFPRATLVPFLDSNPGVLLCLLGTQVVV